MPKYINLEKLNNILEEDTREAFTKQQVLSLLNGFSDLIIEIEDKEEENNSNKIKTKLINAGVYREIIIMLIKIKYNDIAGFRVTDSISDDAEILKDILKSDKDEWDKVEDLQHLREFINLRTLHEVFNKSGCNIEPSWLVLNDLLSYRFLYGDINDWEVPESLRKMEDK